VKFRDNFFVRLDRLTRADAGRNEGLVAGDGDSLD